MKSGAVNHQMFVVGIQCNQHQEKNLNAMSRKKIANEASTTVE